MKKLKIVCLLGIVFALSACKTKPTAETEPTDLTPKLEFVWQSDSLMTTCESVLYDKEAKLIYVANINQSPWEIDNNGFISTLDTNGMILEHKWIEGVSGPKGMGLYDGKLYVNDINRVVEIDITDRKLSNSYVLEGEPALNDITVSSNGKIYTSGSSSNTIYELRDGKLDVVVSDTFGRLNGLLYHDEELYFVSSRKQQFGLFNRNTNSSEILVEGIGHGDGAIALDNGDFMVSNWKGEIYYIFASDWSTKKLLDTKEEGINAADIDYIPEHNLLIVPTFFHNRVMSYRLVYE